MSEEVEEVSYSWGKSIPCEETANAKALRQVEDSIYFGGQGDNGNWVM